MDGRRPRVGLPALGIAVGGVLAGHWLTYVIVRPDHHDRASLLASTGHGYLATAVEVALLAALVAAAMVFLGRLVREDVTPGFRSLAGRLGTFQIGAFVVLEVAERAVASSFDGLLAVCLAGTGVQLLVATAAAWLLRRLERAADVAASVLGRAARTAIDRALAPLDLSPALRLRGAAYAAESIRGPPPLG
jgi:Flp pilus assembly pilin Flp